jgi:hypothetical protein
MAKGSAKFAHRRAAADEPSIVGRIASQWKGLAICRQNEKGMPRWSSGSRASSPSCWLRSRSAWDSATSCSCLRAWAGTSIYGSARRCRVGLYNLFGSIGALIDVATVIALALLAYFVRERGPAWISPRARRGFTLRARPRALVGARLSGQCRAGEMGQRTRALRLDRLPLSLGVGTRAYFALGARRLRRAHRLGACRHASSD